MRLHLHIWRNQDDGLFRFDLSSESGFGMRNKGDDAVAVINEGCTNLQRALIAELQLLITTPEKPKE